MARCSGLIFAALKLHVLFSTFDCDALGVAVASSAQNVCPRKSVTPMTTSDSVTNPRCSAFCYSTYLHSLQAFPAHCWRHFNEAAPHYTSQYLLSIRMPLTLFIVHNLKLRQNVRQPSVDDRVVAPRYFSRQLLGTERSKRDALASPFQPRRASQYHTVDDAVIDISKFVFKPATDHLHTESARRYTARPRSVHTVEH